jgi:hypothetical protein
MWIADVLLVLVFLFLLPGAFAALIKWVRWLMAWVNTR